MRFEDLCGWVILQGSQALNRVLAEPHTLGDLGFGDQEELSAGEDVMYLPGRIYETRFNASLVDRHPETDVFDQLREFAGPEVPVRRSDLRRAYPRTSAVRTQRLPLPLRWLRR